MVAASLQRYLTTMTETKPTPENILEGVKVAQIYASTQYPIVSAYEFEFLKGDEVIRQRLSNCTVYIIVQRPLTYFDNVRLDGGLIEFDITDGTQNPLRCRVPLIDNNICVANEAVDVEVQFFSKDPGREQPFRDVGALKIYKLDGTFVLWWSPQKFLYEVIVKNLSAEITGDPMRFLDFNVHYIGKAFSQKVWDRLAGHEKMQRILTMEGPLGSPVSRAPFEISLIMLDIVGLDDAVEIPYAGMTARLGVPPILHKVDLDEDDAFERFLRQPLVQLRDEALTLEAEAFLIRQFRPAYNEVLYENYPNIMNGMRSKGYTYTDLVIERLPAILRTDHFDAGVADS
jgi:hypothetical protein